MRTIVFRDGHHPVKLTSYVLSRRRGEECCLLFMMHVIRDHSLITGMGGGGEGASQW